MRVAPSTVCIIRLLGVECVPLPRADTMCPAVMKFVALTTIRY